jgi:hypothetical protein
MYALFNPLKKDSRGFILVVSIKLSENKTPPDRANINPRSLVVGIPSKLFLKSKGNIAKRKTVISPLAIGV